MRSSMPVRLIDSFGIRRSGQVRIISNRGANGIDGTIATIAGVAHSTQTSGLIGDLTFLADTGSLRELAASPNAPTVVVINNDGGGIFDFLPQADSTRVDSGIYEQLVRTPHGLDVAPIAAAHGIETITISAQEFTGVLDRPHDGPRIVEVRVTSGSGVAARQQAVEAVRS